MVDSKLGDIDIGETTAIGEALAKSGGVR